MTHKEEMELLKKRDPILYYELTSDPTNLGCNDSSIVALIWIVIIGGLAAIVLTVVLCVRFCLYKLSIKHETICNGCGYAKFGTAKYKLIKLHE